MRWIAIGIFLLLLSAAVSAHERQALEVGGKVYLFTVGSLDEPVAVGDKTGVSVRILLNGTNATPVEGLEELLQVELIAGGASKVLPLEPAWRDPGHYVAYFYPTTAGEYRYRVFGTLNGVPFDVTFTCNDAGHEMHGVETSERVPLSTDVVRVMQAGGFGCPAPREELEFPRRRDWSAVASWAALAAALLALAVSAFRK